MAAPALLHILVVRPYVAALRRLGEEVRGQRALLASEEKALTSLPMVKAELRLAAKEGGRVAGRTYNASDTALATTALGRDVATSLQDAGLAIQRVEMRDSVTHRGGLEELTIDIRAQGGFAAILDALVRLERNPRLIQVSRLSIDRASVGGPTIGDSLSFLAVVHGYAK